MNKLFTQFATYVSDIVGQPVAFVLAVWLIIMWAIAGPIAGFSDTWQLVINTGTTIITFLLVVLLQNTQNRQTKAIMLKLDELIKATSKADNRLVGIEKKKEKKK